MIPPIIENVAGRFMNVTLPHEFVSSWMGWTNEPPKVSGSYWLRYFYATKRDFSEAFICDFDADEQGGGKAVRVCHYGVRTGVTRHMYFWPEPITPSAFSQPTKAVADPLDESKIKPFKGQL